MYGRASWKKGCTSAAWSFVPEGIEMRLFVGEWSKDDNGEEMQQKLKLVCVKN